MSPPPRHTPTHSQLAALTMADHCPTHPTGEEVDVASSKADLLRQLALRRVKEKLAVVRFPLRLTFTGSRRLRRYLTVPVDVDNVGFVDFLLEAMTYNAVIIPEFRERLGLSGTDGEAVRAMGSNGPTVRQRVALPQMWLGAWHTSQASQLLLHPAPVVLQSVKP